MAENNPVQLATLNGENILKITQEEYNDKHGSGNDGGSGMESRVAKLESDVNYIKRDIGIIQQDVKSIDGRLSKIESGIATVKVTLMAVGAVVSVVFATCTYLFGSYVSKMLDALNHIVLR